MGFVWFTLQIAIISLNSINPLKPSVDYMYHLLHQSGSRASSVSIVTDYGLDDRVTGVRSTAGVNNFSSNLCVQTGSEAHPVSCTMGAGGPFPGAKRGRGVTLTTHPSSAEVKNE
jgi:hypothetical protein